MTRKQVIGLLVMLATARFVWNVWVNPEVPVTRRVYGEEGEQLLTQWDRVEVYRLAPLEADASGAVAKNAEYKITSGPIKLDERTSRRLGDILAERASYRPGNWHRCVFSPEVSLCFFRGDSSLEVMVSFDCDIVAAYFDGKAVGSENCENARAALVRIIKPLFPDDEAIQSLSERALPISSRLMNP